MWVDLDSEDRAVGVAWVLHEALTSAIHEPIHLLEPRLADQHVGTGDQGFIVRATALYIDEQRLGHTQELRPGIGKLHHSSSRTASPRRSTTCGGTAVRVVPVSTSAVVSYVRTRSRATRPRRARASSAALIRWTTTRTSPIAHLGRSSK